MKKHCKGIVKADPFSKDGVWRLRIEMFFALFLFAVQIIFGAVAIFLERDD